MTDTTKASMRRSGGRPSARRRGAWGGAFVAALAALCALMLTAPLLAPPAAAQDASAIPVGGVISAIEVTGNQRIEQATVLSYMKLSPGDSFDPGTIDDALKRLFATGLFADVAFRRDGDRLIVQVEENPIVNRVAFEGNSKLDDETLQAETQLRPRVVFTRARVQSDVQRLLELYRRSGRFAATIEPKVIALDQNRVDLVYEIEEGASTGVERINFIGNSNFSDSTLRDVIATRETRWWRLLTTNDNYDPDRLSYDRELLRRYYLAHGYADFRVVSAVAELSPDREDFIITFTIEEGETYDFGAITVETRLEALDPAALEPLLLPVEGDRYNADLVDQTIERMTYYAGEAGYAFVEVRPRVTRDREGRTIGVAFVVDEGPRVYVERIDIEGNVRTIDKVIRREFQLAEGDAFNTAKLERSKRRIEGLGFFAKVDVTQEPGSAPDRTVVKVEVEEQSTGELSIGAGFSSADALIGDIGLTERNFLGRGQYVSIKGTIASRRQQLDFKFTEPYFMDRNLAAGFDLFHTRTNLQSESSFNTRSTGGALRASFPLDEYTRLSLRYTLRNDGVDDIDNDASLAIRAEEGDQITSSLGYSLSYDRRNDPIEPTGGYRLTFGQEIAGLGGDANFVRNDASAKYFQEVFTDIIASVEVEGGLIFPLSGDISLLDRYFVGGDDFRGFENSGVGPRDVDTKDALGANWYAVVRTEVSFPVGLPVEYGVRGAVFADVGTAADLDRKNYIDPINGRRSDIDDSASLRASLGVGVDWESPFGPLRINVAKPIAKEDYDEEELFRFTVGTRF